MTRLTSLFPQSSSRLARRRLHGAASTPSAYCYRVFALSLCCLQTLYDRDCFCLRCNRWLRSRLSFWTSSACFGTIFGHQEVVTQRQTIDSILVNSLFLFMFCRLKFQYGWILSIEKPECDLKLIFWSNFVPC